MLLSCKNVSFSYDGRSVLENVNFTVYEGDYLCIVGENGAGKSTLIKGLLNLKKPQTGAIIKEPGLKKTDVGYLPQQTAVQRDFPATVYEVVESGRLNTLGFRFFYGKEDNKCVLACMEKMGILKLQHKCYRELSGGQQRRVMLARALASMKKILVMDEPAAGLDPIASKEMYELIGKLNKQDGITIIMVSHDMYMTSQYATKILHLDGKQLFFGTKDEYFDSKIGSQFVNYSA